MVRIGAFPALGPGSIPGIGISIFYYVFISHSITKTEKAIKLKRPYTPRRIPEALLNSAPQAL